MMQKLISTRILARLISSAVPALMLFGVGVANAEDVKVGFVYVGPVGDHGWTYRHTWVGRQWKKKPVPKPLLSKAWRKVPTQSGSSENWRQVATTLSSLHRSAT